MYLHKKLCVVGASNIDITGFTRDKLIYQDANIGSMKTSSGGVGRNIAENLVRLGFDVNLISVFGDDPLSSYIIDSCRNLNIRIDDSLFLKNSSAATFLAIMDEHNDLAVGISAMGVYNKISDDFILSKLETLQAADLVVLETNMPKKILQTIVNHAPDKKYVVDTVSGKKALRVKDILSKLYILKTNLLEAQMLSDIKVENESDYDRLIQFFLNKGVKNIFITLGKDGVVYGNHQLIHMKKPIVSVVVNTIGAGDSFVAGLICADALGLDIDKMAIYGMASASINVAHELAVSPEMKLENIRKIIENE